VDGVFDMNVKLMSTMYKDEGVVVKEKKREHCERIYRDQQEILKYI